MKLWQKVFLCSLVLMIVAIETISLVLVRNSQQLMLERERSRGLEAHENLSVGISNQVVYQRLLANELLLERRQVEKQILRCLSAADSEAFGAWVLREGSLVANTPLLPEAALAPGAFSLPEDFVRADSYSVLPVEADGRHILLVASSLQLENERYSLFSLSDITEIYTLQSRQMEFIRNMSLLFSCGTALLLLAMVLRLLSPLQKLHAATRQIAAGDLSVRVQEKGGREFRELAHSLNTMADAVETNVAQLEQVAEARKRFIANLAHEMKTPLTSILGFGDVLRVSRRVTEKQRREYAGIIVEEARRLRALSGKLMELITMGSTALTLSAVSVEALFGEIALALRPALQANRLQLEVLPCETTLYCDETLVKSMLYNLLDNAVKASAKGGRIVLHAGAQEDGLCFSVRDYGIGMSPEAVARAVEPFYMEDKSRSRKAGGAGLGLALCAEIARIHGGELNLRSAPGEGTLVTVTLPFSPPAKQEETT